MYIGLDRDTSIGCFDFVKSPDTRLEPVTVFSDEGVKKEKLIKETDTDCFRVNRITLSGGICALNVEGGYGVYIVTEGAGILKGEDFCREIRKGDYFFMPACLMNKFCAEGDLQIVECF